jgi:phospholipase/carboxylesterase
MTWFRTWLDGAVPRERPVFLVGFSGGAAFAGGLLLADPTRFAGTAILHGTLPFDAGVPTTPGRLAGANVFLAHGTDDTVIPLEPQARTWAYLTGESGAVTVARRDPAGHSLTPPSVDALRTWLDERTEALR